MNLKEAQQKINEIKIQQMQIDEKRSGYVE